MTPEEQQTALISLLRYYGAGDYGRFDHAVETVGFEVYGRTRRNWFVHNLFQAFITAGILDVLEIGHSLRWAISPRPERDSISIKGNNPKEIPLTRHALSAGATLPLISDATIGPLVYGVRANSPSSPGVAFDELFLSRAATLTKTIDDLVTEEHWLNDLTREIELFRVQEFVWKAAALDDVTGPALIRFSGEYGGREYRVIFPDIELNFRILSQEWAHFIAARLMGWDTTSIFQIQDGHLYLPASFRIPTLIRRLLFANSDSVELGAKCVFRKIHKETVNSLYDYFSGGDQQ